MNSSINSPAIHPSMHLSHPCTHSSKDDIEEQSGWEEEEEDGEAQRPQEHGVNVKEGRVDPIPEVIPLPASEQSP